MSRIGKKEIKIPEGVSVKLDGNLVTVEGSKGTLSFEAHPDMTVKTEEGQILVERPGDAKEHRSLHGLTRSLINNMVIGVSEGFKKNLEIQGIGFRAVKEGKTVVFNLGYSHQITIDEPEGITIDVTAPTRLTVSGIDKQLVGQVSAKIKSFRIPDAYHGKGIKYDYEVLRLKEGKTGA